MIQAHSSTAEQKARWVSQLLAHEGSYGEVSRLSRSHGISRQSLYGWKAKGKHALEEAFTPASVQKRLEEHLEVQRAILTLFTEAHASYRGIQACLRVMMGKEVSVGTICATIQAAGHRALDCLQKQGLGKAVVLALDEQYQGQKEGYLNVLDAHSGLVLATHPPVKVDGESWVLALWYLQEQGIAVEELVSDGGRAIHEAVDQLGRREQKPRDVWHLLHAAGHSLAELDRKTRQEEERWLMIDRRKLREAASGKKEGGRQPKTTESEQEELLIQMHRVLFSVRYLCAELRRILEKVVTSREPHPRLLCYQQRLEELQTILERLSEVAHSAPSIMKKECQAVVKHLKYALPSFLHFAEMMEPVQQEAVEQAGEEAVGLIAWAWRHRAVLGSCDQLLKALPLAWRAVAARLFALWDQAVRASSVVENWHSILRPYLAVHRRLSAGMLARLSVWHNHRVAPRGLHEGRSPLQRSGCQTAAQDWLEALGYPSAA